MGMNGKMETMARTEAGSVEEKILELFAPSLSGSDVPSLKDWDPWGISISSKRNRSLA